MSTRIMWTIVRWLFKIALVSIVISLTVLSVAMAYYGLFNLDQMWPFNLIF